MATTYRPHGRYDFVCDVTDFDDLVLFADFECELDVEVELSGNGFDLVATCTDVLVDGVSLRQGGELAKSIRTQVMMKADEELENGGWLFDQVREAEGLSLTGHPNDPDTHWQQAW